MGKHKKKHRKKAAAPVTAAPVTVPPLSGDASDEIPRDNGVDLHHRQSDKPVAVPDDSRHDISRRRKTEKPTQRKVDKQLSSKPTKRQNLKAARKARTEADAVDAEKAAKAVPPKAADRPKNNSASKKKNQQSKQKFPDGSDHPNQDIQEKSKLHYEQEPEQRQSKLRFDEADTSTKPGMVGTLKKLSGKAAGKTVIAVGAYAHGKIHEVEHENASVEGSHNAELLAETSIRELHQYSKNHAAQRKMKQKSSRVQDNTSDTDSKLHHGEHTPQDKGSEDSKHSRNRFYQKKRNKRQASQAARSGAEAASKAAEATTSATEHIAIAVEHFFRDNKKTFRIILIVLLVILLFVSMLQSCSTMVTGSLSAVTASSWPAADAEITAADLYYTKLEAELQEQIDNIESTYSGYDEYNYNIGEIGHDPVILISYLSAKYGDFTFNQVKSELDSLFALQYRLNVQTTSEERTVTRTLSVGDAIGTVVTSAYCSCEICCGQWAGGPTASGVYPTANHTIAVDANDPIVPIGTEIVMNGTLYKVEDTGNFARYGVDFDIYFDDHDTALAWGHQSFTAYYAGGNSNTIDVTTTETVYICNVTLSSTNLTNLISSRLNSEQLELYTVYVSTRGNRQFLGTPLAANWYGNVSSYYGYRIHPISGNFQIHRGLDIATPQRTEILAVHDGTVTTVAYDSGYGNYVVIENNEGYTTKYAHCYSVSAAVGQVVQTGNVIATVGSTGTSTGPHLHIEFLYQGEYLNPYFYLNVGSGSLYGNGFGYTGDVDALDDERFATLIAEAERYLGMAYVWGGSSPSTGFDCSGFVSYVFTNSGVYNMGRLTAQGIYNICAPVSPSDAQPGDIIFFTGTYETTGVSHVGIYVGNGQMIHCGDPIQYTSINTAYWQSHFYAFGRVG